MGGFFSSMFEQMAARQRRLRAALGDRGQAIVQFLVIGGLALGSLGLFVRPWMAEAAPWGFWLPAVFVVGYLLIEYRRQAAAARAEDPTQASAAYDWTVLLWSLACALAGAAAFVIAMGSEPAPAPEEDWTPPEDAVSVDILP